MLLRLLLLAALGYAVAALLMYVFQRRFQYYPDRTRLQTPKDAGAPWMTAVSFDTEDGLTLQAWYAPPRQKDGKIVVLFHGNAGNISHRGMKSAYFYERDYGVLLVEYRGFGGNPGTPSEQGLYKDARAALHFLERQGFNSAQFVLYGESLGTGVAIEMARHVQPPQLILEAPFTSAADVAALTYFWLPVHILMKDKFDSLSKITEIKTSLLVVHGDEDGVIPLALAEKLYEAAGHPKEFITINGGSHSDLYEHHAGHLIADWLDRQGGRP